MSFNVTKRFMDVVGAGIGLAITGPLLLLAALAIFIEDGAPVLFRQERVGKHEKLFVIYKLRTMKRGSGKQAVGIQPADPRVTRVGKILRATSIDELPQFVNILKGDMSIVGPRPTMGYQVEQYVAWQRRRHDVRPGITGWAQVNGRNRIPWAERIKLDVWYVENKSLSLDLRIVGRTVVQVFRRADTYASDGGTLGFRDRAES